MKYFAPNLLIRTKWHEKKSNAGVGDLVLEIDSKRKRGEWKMALMEEVFPRGDDLVRKVKIRTSKEVYERPIAKLCLICNTRRTRTEWDSVILEGLVLRRHNHYVSFLERGRSPHWGGGE